MSLEAYATDRLVELNAAPAVESRTIRAALDELERRQREIDRLIAERAKLCEWCVRVQQHLPGDTAQRRWLLETAPVKPARQPEGMPGVVPNLPVQKPRNLLVDSVIVAVMFIGLAFLIWSLAQVKWWG